MLSLAQLQALLATAFAPGLVVAQTNLVAIGKWLGQIKAMDTSGSSSGVYSLELVTLGLSRNTGDLYVAIGQNNGTL